VTVETGGHKRAVQLRRRTESKGLALVGAGVTVTADAAAVAGSLTLNMKTSSWEAQGLAKRGKEEEEGPC